MLLVLLAVPALAGCSTVKKVVVKDIPLEEQKALRDEYRGRSAWTRGVLEDMGEGGSIPRDTKVMIADVGMVYSGTVTIQMLKRRNHIVHAMDLEKPLSKAAIEARMQELFWFDDPTIRHVLYIRKWGKKAARAIVDHEVFIGLTSEGAIESWGYPAKKNTNEIGGKSNEQWVYPDGKRNRYIYIIDGRVSKWED